MTLPPQVRLRWIGAQGIDDRWQILRALTRLE